MEQSVNNRANMILLVYGILSASGMALVESTQANLTACQNGTDFQISNGPLIIPCLNEIVLEKGQNYTLTCKSNSPIQFQQQEISEEITDGFKKINRNTTLIDEEYSYESSIDLYDIDQYAIGYYMCSDEHVASNSVNNLIEEPTNNEHASYIYVYVNGTDSLFAPMSEVVMPRADKVVIQCRPSTPNVSVELTTLGDIAENVTKQFKPKIGFIVDNANRFTTQSMFTCKFERDHIWNTKDAIFVEQGQAPPEPKVFPDRKQFLAGETIVLNCTAPYESNTAIHLSWILPNGLVQDNVTIVEDTNEQRHLQDGSQLYRSLTMYNATEKHGGTYMCSSENCCTTKKLSLVYTEFLENAELTIEFENSPSMGTRQENVTLNVNLYAYPEASYKFLKDGKELPDDPSKYFVSKKPTIADQVLLKIFYVTLDDVANYTMVASNKYFNKSTTYELKVFALPKVNFGKSDKTCLIGHKIDFHCDVTGYPLPEVKWKFTSDGRNETLLNSTRVVRSPNKIYKETAYLTMEQCNTSGNITCIADDATATHSLLIYEIDSGFGITTESENHAMFVLEKQQVNVKCLASKYILNNVTWNAETSGYTVEYIEGNFSHEAILRINSITLNNEGNYTCRSWKNDSTMLTDNIQINVEALRPPKLENPGHFEDDVYRFMHTTLNCIANGAPEPQIEWYKDGEHLKNGTQTNVKVFLTKLNRYEVNSTVLIDEMQEENEGTYECVVKSTGFKSTGKTFTLKLKTDKTGVALTPILVPILVIFGILFILLIILTIKMKKEKRKRKQLQAAGLLHFKDGVTKSINPKLAIDEQAELLPYDEKFEFPREMLKLGKQLGAGAFGVVIKAEARGIVNAEETTTVAVKMVKKTADNIFIKALASELKIMVHLGRHINIVNLLGACTKNVVNRELFVIVEYCKFGNIHNYLQKHREVFVDQLTGEEKHLGKVNKAYNSSTCGSTGDHSDYFGSTNTQETDNTFVNTANTARSERKNIPKNTQPMEEMKVSEGYVQPEWRSNYQSDYSSDGHTPRVLTSRDLLAWAFQIARGMEYLASRKILHGDLAARNVLLAEDNIVKICDFGLARCIYKNDEYHAKTNNPMPVKWLAIECMTDGIFSTQSDVWSFGIVLWEMFSLAKTPYPNIDHKSLLKYLLDGNRLDKPAYSNEQIYNLMKRCWEYKPTMRPTFTELQETIGSYLEENVRNFYVDLNSTYMENNAAAAGQEDYLAMMCAPDYNNIVTPSPQHEYVNERRFFPSSPAPKVDNEGYLEVSPSRQGIFSPRDATKFDFDSHKLNQKISVASSHDTEITPMLGLKSSTGGFESDNEGEGNTPSLNLCPRIDEETDDVFTPRNENSKNAKNILQSAVTNPTYITFDIDEKKPKDIKNDYVNYNASNGLVK